MKDRTFFVIFFLFLAAAATIDLVLKYHTQDAKPTPVVSAAPAIMTLETDETLPPIPAFCSGKILDCPSHPMNTWAYTDEHGKFLGVCGFYQHKLLCYTSDDRTSQGRGGKYPYDPSKKFDLYEGKR